MNKGKKLYEGKAKILYEGPEKGTAIQHFKDSATAYNNLKKYILNSEFSYISDLLKTNDLNKNLLVFESSPLFIFD